MTNKILAIDTATEQCSVALDNNGDILFDAMLAPREHTQKVLPMVDSILHQANLKLTELDALAFGCGPGSFTGVRIGIGITQGLAFGAQLPMIGISNLKAMAQGAYREKGATKVCVAIDARMSEIYTATYIRNEDGSWDEQIKEQVISPATISKNTWLLSQNDLYRAGTGWEAYAQELAPVIEKTLDSGVLYPHSQDIVVLAQPDFIAGKTVQPEAANPVYLRDKVTWKKLPGKE